MNKIIPILIIAALPFFVWGDSVLQGQLNGLLFLIVLASVLSMPHNWLKIIGLMTVGWLGFAYSAAFVSNFPSGPFVDAALIILCGVLVYLTIFNSAHPISFYANLICISAVIQAGLAIIQYLWFDPISTVISSVISVRGEMPFRTPVGTLGNPNFLGAYLAISIPFFFRSGWLWFIPMVACGLFISNTATAVVAAILGTAYFFGGWTWVCLGMFPAALYFASLSGHNMSGGQRLDFWADAVRQVCKTPTSFLFGYGPGVTWQEGNQLHSEYVATFFNYGAVGLSCMVAYIVTAFRVDRILFSAFLILCINMIGNHPLHTTPPAVLAITIIVLMDREKYKSVQNKERVEQ